jgi:phage terminase small subunit
VYQTGEREVERVAKTNKMKKLNDRQIRFVEAYVETLSVPKAVKAAGWKAPEHGWHTLRLPHVAHAVQMRQQARASRIEVDADYVVNRLIEVVERCLQREPVMRWDPAAKTEVQEVDDEGRHVWAFDSQGANRALELLGRHLGMFDVKIKVDGYLGILHLLAGVSPDQAQRLLEMDDRQLREVLSEAEKGPALLGR